MSDSSLRQFLRCITTGWDQYEYLTNFTATYPLSVLSTSPIDEGSPAKKIMKNEKVSKLKYV
jgi:hypothetical protein